MSSSVFDQMSDQGSCSTCSCRTTQVPTLQSISSQLNRLQAEMDLLKLGQQSLQYSMSSSLYMLSSQSEKSLHAAERAPVPLPQTVVDQDHLFSLLEKIQKSLVPLESYLNALPKTFIDFRERAELETRQVAEQQKTTLEGITNIPSPVSDLAAAFAALSRNLDTLDLDSNISSNSSKAQVQVKSPAPSSHENSEREHTASTLATEGCQKSTDSLPSSTLVSDPTAMPEAQKTEQMKVVNSVQDNEDVTSPYREILRAKIDGIKKILIELNETSSHWCDDLIELPGDFSTIDDDVYATWCTSSQYRYFQRNLFQLIERLQGEEEQERKRLRDMDTRIYGVEDDSPHRRHLRAKIEAAKLSSWEFISKGMQSPKLPAEPLLMDVDLFRANRACYEGYSGVLKSDSYVTNIGFLITDFVARENEEGQYLYLRKKNGNQENQDIFS
ncbi:hypothetical protein EDD21DRAFT_368146 [Dissophora ornata]|nr:hypothetical protein EDD21DRAFT_368146 [Dissophora ornata]